MNFIELTYLYWGAIPKQGEFFKENDPSKIAEMQMTLMESCIDHYDRTKTMRPKALDQAMQMVLGKAHRANSITGCVECLKNGVLRLRHELSLRKAKTAASAAIEAGESPMPQEEPQPQAPIATRIVYVVWSQDGKAGIKPAKALKNLPSTNVMVQLLDPIGSVAVEWPRDAVHEVLQIALNAASALVGRDVHVGPIDPSAIEHVTLEFTAPVAPLESLPPIEQIMWATEESRIDQSKVKKGTLLDNGDMQVTVTKVAASIVYYVDANGAKDSTSLSTVGSLWMVAN